MDTENQLVAAAVAGDREAFSELVQRHRAGIHALARMLTDGDVEAEDLVQETLIRAYRAIRRFRGSRFKTWLHRITVNVVRAHSARRRRDVANRCHPTQLIDEFDALQSGEDVAATRGERLLEEVTLQ